MKACSPIFRKERIKGPSLFPRRVCFFSRRDRWQWRHGMESFLSQQHLSVRIVRMITHRTWHRSEIGFPIYSCLLLDC